MIFTKRNFAAFTVLIFVLTLSVCGQSGRPTELAFGNEISGNLGSGEGHFFIVKPTEDGIIIVETSGDLGTRLEAFDESNKKLWENTGGGEGSNAKLVIFVEAGKTYNIKLTEVIANLEVWTTTLKGGPYSIVANFVR